MKLSRTDLIILPLVIAVVFLYLYQFVLSSDKIAYVDSGKLLSGYKAMVEVRSEFDKKQSSWKANIDTLTKDVEDAIKKYEKTAAMGSEKERQLAKELIGTRQKQLYDYQTVIKQNASEEEQRLTQNILFTINNYLERYGKKHHYKIILVAANGNIAYADSGIDITDQIVENLNAEYSLPAKEKQ